MRENILPHGIATSQFIEDANRLTTEGLMEKYGVSDRTIRRWKQWIREKDDEIISLSFPDSPSKQCTDFLKLNYDRVLVVGDVEIPDHDPVILDMVVKVAGKLGVEHLIINGDFVALDAFSNWPQDNEQSRSFRGDNYLAMKTLKVFLNTFDTVDYIIGNHERRLARQTRGQINTGFFYDLLEIQYSNYTYCELTSGDKEILVCHPEDYSRVPLAVPRRLATVHHKNVLCGHTHALEMGYDDSGKYWIACGGHARDETRTMYKAMKMASYPKWNAGFSLIIDGNLYLINKDNFDFWMNNVVL